jgi:hypothetical protein
MGIGACFSIYVAVVRGLSLMRVRHHPVGLWVLVNWFSEFSRRNRGQMSRSVRKPIRSLNTTKCETGEERLASGFSLLILLELKNLSF